MSRIALVCTLTGASVVLATVLWLQGDARPASRPPPNSGEIEEGREAAATHTSAPARAPTPGGGEAQPPPGEADDGTPSLLESLASKGDVTTSLESPTLDGYPIDSLRLLVERERIAAIELREAAGRMELDDPRLLPTLLAMAWSEEYGPSDRGWLTDVASSLPSEDEVPLLARRRRMKALAAIHALRLREDQGGAIDVVLDLLPRLDEEPRDVGSVGVGLTIALSTVD